MQNRNPMILVLAGPNGSGKSTITTFFDKVGKYTNADDIVAATGMDNMEAAILVDKMRYDSIDKKEDFMRKIHFGVRNALKNMKKGKWMKRAKNMVLIQNIFCLFVILQEGVCVVMREVLVIRKN